MNAKDKTMTENIDTTMDAANNAVHDATSKLSDMTDKATEKVRSVAHDLSAKASDAASAVRDTAVDRMNEARDALSESGDRLAETLRRAAEEPEAGSVQARVLSAVASGVSTAAGTLRDRSVSEIATDLRDLARRNPAVFAAGAAVAGFALARFLRASQRRQHDYPYGDMRVGQSTYQPGHRADEGRS